MTKARNIADLLDANGDVKSASLDNVPASNDASALTTGTLPNARLPNNIIDGGTAGTKLASGSTAQRGSTTGQIRFNSTTGLAEYYTGTAFKSIDAAPTVTSIDVTEVDSQAGGNQTIVITGSGFNSGASVSYIGTSVNFNASTITVNSDTQITAVAPKSSFLNAQEPYGVKVTNISGLAGTLASQINVDTSPSWQTASGSLGTLAEGTSANVSVSATDPDGDTVAYSVQSGSLPSGASLNSSTGAITGTLSSVSANTTSNFTLRATANAKTVDRAFSMITQNVIGDVNSIPESLWNDIPTGNFSGASTYTDYYGGRFDVLSGNIMKFRSEFTNEHVMYQRANSRSNSNEECYIQMYDISNDFGDASNGDQCIQFGIVEDDVTDTGKNNNTMFGYVPTSYTKSRYAVWGQSDTSSVHGFYTGGAGGSGNASINSATSNREVLGNYRLNEYQLNFTPTSASTRTAITFVIKPDNHSTNARKVYMYYGNTKVHTFANTIGASSTVHFYCGVGGTTSSNGDFWTNNPPRIRFADNDQNTTYNVGG